MKKIIIALIIVGMVGWTIYDFVISSDSKAEVGTEVGDLVPDFSLETLDGELVSISDYHGKKIMLNFWATWCGPCRNEMPAMQNLYDDTDVEILAINATTTELRRDEIEPFVEELSLTFPILMDEEGEIGQMFSIAGFPTSYLIDSNGVIQRIALGEMDYETMVEEFKNMN